MTERHRLQISALKQQPDLNLVTAAITPANRTAMPDAKHHRWPKPSELAAVLAFLVSDDAALISGAAISVYGRA
jgi:NAD(P)-dependent dehydrogenase (short-subunit alcohol dehydrogenase family)